jgi:hypothetical protein
LILVAVLYGLALLFGRRHLTDGPDTPVDDDGDTELVTSAAQPAPASP